MRPMRGAAALAVVGVVWLAWPAPAHADIFRGLAYLVGGVLEIPRSVLVGTMSGPPLVGTVAGLLTGTFNSALYLSKGVLEVAGSAVPIARAVGPLLLPFLL
jgi:hypothetical protein